MDAYLIVKQLEQNKKKIEKMNQANNDNGVNIGLIISIIIGAYASYLSYECNTKHNVPEIQKILFAVLAYIFGLFYLIYYFLFRYDSCHE
jgi:uncharacterized protein YacL